MQFKPENTGKSRSVPFFEDVRLKDGWEGQATTKTLTTLQQELSGALSRLGGGITKVQWGEFQDGATLRKGCQIDFSLMRDDGGLDRAQLSLAALPCRRPFIKTSKRVTAEEASKRMLLFMAARAFGAMWILQQLSPGTVALLPFLLGPNGTTLSQIYSQQGQFSNLLPSPEARFIEGEIVS